jgi:hypothetical protein
MSFPKNLTEVKQHVCAGQKFKMSVSSIISRPLITHHLNTIQSNSFSLFSKLSEDFSLLTIVSKFTYIINIFQLGSLQLFNFFFFRFLETVCSLYWPQNVYVDQAAWSNRQTRFSCFCFPNVRIAGMYHYTRLHFHLKYGCAQSTQPLPSHLRWVLLFLSSL